MRTTILLVLALLPALGACGSAHANGRATSPVCTHYDDVDKPAARASAPAQAPAGAASAATIAPPAAAAAAPVAAAPPSRGGGTDSIGHAHSSPRWQTFLPGMFK